MPFVNLEPFPQALDMKPPTHRGGDAPSAGGVHRPRGDGQASRGEGVGATCCALLRPSPPLETALPASATERQRQGGHRKQRTGSG